MSECTCHNASANALAAEGNGDLPFAAIELRRVNALAAMLPAAASGAADVEEHILVTQDGDALVARSSVDASGEGTVTLRGTIGPVPVALTITIGYSKGKAVVTLELSEPLVFQHSWTFEVGAGVALDPHAQVSAAAAAADAALRLNWRCVLRCGGLAIMRVLVQCIPALAGGPAAYVACVTKRVGAGSAAEIAMCVARRCT
ncbi:hypothetical protein [Salinarimonas sp.]|uniref:hypothetical protein n=1 Tax=Salinarimonas sp. TaxID=2766526 RepID=UPI00391C0EB3